MLAHYAPIRGEAPEWPFCGGSVALSILMLEEDAECQRMDFRAIGHVEHVAWGVFGVEVE